MNAWREIANPDEARFLVFLRHPDRRARIELPHNPTRYPDMTTRAIELTKIKRDLANLPVEKLAEVREYVRKLLPAKRAATPPPEPLRGIWKNMDWEKIDDLEGE